MAEEKTMREFFNPRVDVQQAIVIPTIEAESYEINPGIIQIIIQDYQFDGTVDEDPYYHLSDFLAICHTFKLRGVSDDAVRLLLFPFSLRNQAKSWLQSLPDNSITTWDELVQKFLSRFNPQFKAAKMNNGTFNQQPQHKVKRKNNLEELMRKYIAEQERRNNESDDEFRKLQESVHNLENQVGQISNMLAEGRVGSFHRESYPYYNYS